MQNLTKSLEQAVNQNIDPIFEELNEQFEAAHQHRLFASYREKTKVQTVEVKQTVKA